MSRPQVMPSMVPLETVDRTAEAEGSHEQDALLSIRGVRRRFFLGETVIDALRGVDLEIEAKSFMAVWGPSGSGKSTLMNLIGLVDAPTEGAVWFVGVDTMGLDDNALTRFRRDKVGFIFQNFNLVPVLSAIENVMLPLQFRGYAERQARRRAAVALEEVGLGDCLNARPDKLSGGQRQRVAIARALIGEPLLVIADEPTANLDSENSQAIISLMRELNRSKGVTFVFTTHDPRLLSHVDRKVLLRDGEIVQDERLL